MRVEIYEANSKYELKEKLNKILKEYENDEIIDIKYGVIGTTSIYDYYSAMIIFKK